MSLFGRFINSVKAIPSNLLTSAVRNNSTMLARTLIFFGVNPRTIRDSNNNNLLHLCYSESMGFLLIQNGVDISGRNSKGQTPLHRAMRNNVYETLRPYLFKFILLLIEQGTDVNAAETDGENTPLHLAERIEIVNALLAKRANPNQANSVGDTPLHVAVRIPKAPNVVSALVNNGARDDIPNDLQETPRSLLKNLSLRSDIMRAKINKIIEIFTRQPPVATVIPASPNGMFTDFEQQRELHERSGYGVNNDPNPATGMAPTEEGLYNACKM